jgi:lambda family phage portal protein
VGFLDKAIGALSPAWAAKRNQNKVRSKLAADFPAQYLGGQNGSLAFGGSQGSRVSTPWLVSPKDPSLRFASYPAMRAMRDRARSLERNNELAKALLETTVANVVGPKGFQLQCNANNPAWTEEHNAAWNKQAQKLMEDWFTTADISGRDWVDHQKTVFRSCLRDGDVGVILDEDGYLQGIEGDLIADPDVRYAKQNSINTDNILFGVEVDGFNNALAYWVTPLSVGTSDDAPPSQRIAEQDFIFIPNRTRFGQLRGETIYTTIFDLLDQISKWKQATLMSALIAACFGVAITKNDGGQNVYTPGNAAVNSAGQNQSQINLEPGSIQYLQPGESIETINPANPGHNFPQNLTAMVRLAGLPFRMPLELVLLDFSKTNYSSARASLQQAYAGFESWQEFFKARYLKRVYQWRISKFIKAGALEANPDAWSHRWISKAWPFLDPQVEFTAIQMGIDIGTTTLTDVLQAHGIGIDDYIAKRRTELEKLLAAKIPVLHSQSLTADGAPAPTDPADDEETTDQPSPDNDNEDNDNEDNEITEDGDNND